MSVSELFKRYQDAGFFFTEKLISNYCLSLYTKPFVILSGISGTGKTKIAQLFNPYFPEIKKVEPTEPKKDYVSINMTEGILNGDGRGNFKQTALSVLLTKEEHDEVLKEREELLRKGTLDNFGKLYTITVVTDDDQRLPFKFYVQRATSPLVRARFKSKRFETPEYDLQPYLRSRYTVGDVIHLKKIKDKEFRIVKATDSKEIEDVKAAILDVNNISLIPVRSDWTDPSGLIGFFNIIENKYHLGPLLRHILHAIENPTIPFFVILDEMNLSKVEFYLSDILSLLETRISIDTNAVTQEPLILHQGAQSGSIETDDDFFDMIPSRIYIPFNLYITGTINVDESTYMPSPKVLDRSNVIEFNEVDFDNYFKGESKLIEDIFSLSSVPDFTSPSFPSRRLSQSVPEFIKLELFEINSLLMPYNMHFGYRVLNEICLYVNNVSEYLSKEEQILKTALDLQVLQKVLPKFAGSFSKLEEPIRKLISKFSAISYDSAESLAEGINKLDASKSDYRDSLSKLIRIYRNLMLNGYAAFIE